MNDLSWSKVVLVEGVSGIGKSTLIATLLRQYIRQNKALRTLLHLTQAHTYGPLAPDEDDISLTVEQNISHLQSICSMLSWCIQSLRDEKKPKFYCIIDTLHITHCFRPGRVSWSDVMGIDQELASLKVKLIFLKANKESVWERGIWRRRDEQFITQYAQKFGNSLEEIFMYFIEEQAGMEEVMKKSMMDKLILNVDTPINSYARKAYDFWMC